MLPGNLNVDQVHCCLTEAIHQDDFDLDRAGNCEDVDLEHLFDLEIEVWPANGCLVGLGDFAVVDMKHCVDLHTLDFALPRLLRRGKLLVWRDAIVVLQVQELVNLATVHTLLMNFELDVGRQELILRSLLHDPSPDRIQTIRHLVDLELFFLETPFDFFARFD